MQPSNPLQLARKKGDVVVLIITILVVVGLIALAADTSLTLLSALILILAFFLLYIRLQQVSLLGNSLRVQNGRHAYLNEYVKEITPALNVPPVDVYITQNPVLNAYAIGYTRPFSIVLHSSVVEELEPAEVKAILIHEIGHIKYKHTIILSYLGPLAVVVPIVGPAVSWIFGFWGRRAEMACDRLATAYTEDPHTVIMALIKVHVGSKFAEYMGEEGVIYQRLRGRGLMRKLAQTLPSHPFLVTRVWEILDFSQRVNIPLPQNVLDYLKDYQNKG